MGMLRQLGRLQAAATGPPRWVFDPKADPCPRALETLMISTIETGPAEAGVITFRPHPAHAHRAILSLDLGTTTGWALRSHDGLITSGTVSFRPSRYDGGGMRYLRFRSWLDQIAADAGGLAAIYFEEVRRHVGTDAAHLYGGFLATLSAWCESHAIAMSVSALLITASRIALARLCSWITHSTQCRSQRAHPLSGSSQQPSMQS